MNPNALSEAKLHSLGECLLHHMMPHDPARRRARLAAEAEGYLFLGMPEQALESLDRIGDDVPEFQEAYLRGMAYRELRQHPEALMAFLPAYRQAESVEADAAVSLFLAMAWCYKRVNQVAQSVALLQQAHKREPENALLLYNLACYWALLDNKTQALTWLGLALRKDPAYRAKIPNEPDFDALRDDPDFQFIVGLREHGRPTVE